MLNNSLNNSLKY